MEKKIREATDLITGGKSGDAMPAITELTKCAINIASIAFIALRGKLREKALNVACAIMEYEDESGA